MDTLSWHQVKGSFIADEAYQYVLIGNFFDDIHTETLAANQFPVGNAYYYVDEIRVSTDSSYAWETLNIGKVQSEVGIHFYPNPVRDVLHVHSDHTIHSYELLNNMGQAVMVSNNSNSKSLEIGVSHLPTGIYFLKIYTREYAHTVKIITRE